MIWLGCGDFGDGFDTSEALSLSRFKGSGRRYEMTNFTKNELYKMLAFFICEHQI